MALLLRNVTAHRFRYAALCVILLILLSNHLLHTSSSNRSQTVVTKFPAGVKVLSRPVSGDVLQHLGHPSVTILEAESPRSSSKLATLEFVKMEPAGGSDVFVGRALGVIPAVNGPLARGVLRFANGREVPCAGRPVSSWPQELTVCPRSSNADDGLDAALSNAEALVDDFFAVVAGRAVADPRGLSTAEAVAEDFGETLAAAGTRQKLRGIRFAKHSVGTGPTPVSCDIVVQVPSSSPVDVHDGYGLRVEPDRIVVTATGKIGVAYALYTWLQLATSSNVNATQCIDILWDAPKKSWRGQHLDTARHFHDLPFLLRLVRRLARLKMNKLHLHLTDEQGWRMESQVFPELHLVGSRRGPSLNGHKFKKYNGVQYENATFHSQEELRVLAVYASVRGIELIPEIDLPGHAFALISAIRSAGKHIGGVLPVSKGNADCIDAPEGYQGALNCMGGVFGLVDPSREAIDVVSQIVREVCDVFELSTHIHLGADEAEFARDKLWGGKTFDGVPVTDPAATQTAFIEALIRVVHAANKTAVVWDEAVLEAPDGYLPPAPTKVMLWRDDRASLMNLKTVFQKQQRELPVIFAPKTRLYFDYIQHAKLVANRYGAFQRPPPWANYKAVTLKRAHGAHGIDAPFVEGYQSCLWTELVPTSAIADYQLFPRLFATADVGWANTGIASSPSTIAPGVRSFLTKDFEVFLRAAETLHPHFADVQV